jgi:hypothetical protein
MSKCISNYCKSHCNSHNNESPKSFKEVAEFYIKNYRGKIKDEIKKIKKDTLQNVLKKYGYGKNMDDKYVHLNRLKKDSLEEAGKKLRELENKFVESKNFDEIFNTIQNKIEAEIKGIGEMYTYDTALSIGHKLGILPEFIYLHRGTRKGAKLLDIKLEREIKISKNIEGMPKEFQIFEPYEIEDILCLYKKDFQTIISGSV